MAGKKTEDTGGYPVIVVPGWGAPLFHTNMIAKKLEAEGLEVSSLFLPHWGMGDMDRSAELLSDKVDEVARTSGAERVHLVGYSLGGLICRVYLQKFGGASKLERAVYVGAPQDGVYTGYPAAFTAGGRQVCRGSAYMKELNRGSCPECSGRKCLSIYTTKDVIILPAQSARLDCGYNLELTDVIFHWGLVFNRRIMKTAAEYLKGEVPEGAAPGKKVDNRQ